MQGSSAGQVTPTSSPPRLDNVNCSHSQLVEIFRSHLTERTPEDEHQTASYSVGAAGEFTLAVRCAGVNVNGSPFRVRSMPAAWGEALNHAVRQLESNRRPTACPPLPSPCLSWKRTGDPQPARRLALSDGFVIEGGV